MRLASPFLELEIEPECGSFSLIDRSNDKLSFSDAKISVRYHQNNPRRIPAGAPWEIISIRENLSGLFSFDTADCVDLMCETDLEGLNLHLRFALLKHRPLAAVRMELTNNSAMPIKMERLTLAAIQAGNVNLNFQDKSNPGFYSNGWQSWSPSGAYRIGEKQQHSMLGFLTEPMIINHGTPATRQINHFTSDMFGIVTDLSTRYGLLAGFLSQKQQFGSIETRFTPLPSLKIWANGDLAQLNPGQSMISDWAAFQFINLDEPDPLKDYLECVKLENNVHIPEVAPLGWCSWYQFFTKVTEEDLVQNLASLVHSREDLPLSLFQVDDGFESAVGDWFSFNKKFPRGVAPLAEAITSKGLTPGLWLAPFIVQSGAKVLKLHPDWALRSRSGRPVNAGFGWNGLTNALDLTNPEALNYVQEVISKAVFEWGYPYLKLDFLYAAALHGAYQDASQTRAQVMRRGLEAIREAAGREATLLACGCPLGSALGLFDTMRISADVAPSWLPSFGNISTPLKNEPNMPSARNAIQNILTRAYLDKNWWRNDPDCLLIRTDSNLTLAEVQSLASVIGLTGGAMLLSDDLPKLPTERLRIAQMLIPTIEERCHIIDLFDKVMPEKVNINIKNAVGEWDILAVFNWQDVEKDLSISLIEYGLEEQYAYIGRELWTGQIINVKKSITLGKVPAHGVRLLALRRFNPECACYVGSSLHLSQGIELYEWVEKQTDLRFKLGLPRNVQGEVFLYLPKEASAIFLDNKPVSFSKQETNIYNLQVNFKYTADVQVIYK